jgi:hypothetical protein
MNNVAIKSDQQRCEALVTYSKCLSQFDADKEAEELLFRQVSVSQSISQSVSHSKNCDQLRSPKFGFPFTVFAFVSMLSTM